MAHIDNTMFSQRVTNAAHDDIANIAGIFVNSEETPELVSSGFLCKRFLPLDAEAYGGLIKNQNAWKMVAAEDTDLATDGIYAVNPYGVNEATSNGNVYKIGQNTLGLDVPAGERTAFTKIDFLSGDKIYRFGIGNLDAALSTNTFFTITDGMLTPAAAAPSGTVGLPYFEMVGTGTLIEGTYAAFGYVDVIAKVAMA